MASYGLLHWHCRDDVNYTKLRGHVLVFDWIDCLYWISFLVAKTLNVDDDWAEMRAFKLRTKTYDHKHIDQIVNSAVDSDPTEDPAAPHRH